jgi:hypothetical protein
LLGLSLNEFCYETSWWLLFSRHNKLNPVVFVFVRIPCRSRGSSPLQKDILKYGLHFVPVRHGHSSLDSQSGRITIDARSWFISGQDSSIPVNRSYERFTVKVRPFLNLDWSHCWSITQ